MILSATDMEYRSLSLAGGQLSFGKDTQQGSAIIRS